MIEGTPDFEEWWRIATEEREEARREVARLSESHRQLQTHYISMCASHRTVSEERDDAMSNSILYRKERDEACADAEHWRREADLRQSLLENERQLCAIHEAKRDEARAKMERLHRALYTIATGTGSPLKIADIAVWAQKTARAALGGDIVTPCAACDSIGGDDTDDGWAECQVCEASGFLVNGRAPLLEEYMRLTGGSRLPGRG